MDLMNSTASSIMPGTYSTAIAQGSPGGLPVPSAEMVGLYARLTDLYSEKTDLVLCSAYGAGNYFWQPVRPLWMNTAPVSANQDLTLFPLRSPSVLRLTGTMTANRTITPSKVGAWPGCQFEIAMEGTLGLFGLTIAGLSLGSTLQLLLNGRRRIIFDGTDYQSY